MRVSTRVVIDIESMEVIERDSYEYAGPVDKCGGASEQEQAAQAQEASFNTELQGNYATRFGEQSQIFQQLTNALNPILAKGPNQQGYSAPELAAFNSQAITGVGQNYQNAQRAVNAQQAGQGNGGGAGTAQGSGLQSGVGKQINAAIASSAAGQTSGEELGIQQANYAQGLANWQNAVSGLGGVASAENPSWIAGANNTANGQNFSEANTINQQNQAWENQLVGGITGLAGGALGAFTGGFGGSAASSAAGGMAQLEGATYQGGEEPQEMPISTQLLDE